MGLIAYARVSTDEQRLDLQLDALKDAGCEKIFTDQGVSGAKTSRPGLDAALEYIREGDTLVVWRLDRVSRSLVHLLRLVEDLDQRGVHLRSLSESLDTSGPTGRFTLQILGSVAQLERDLVRERTNAGLASARRQGRVGGRPRALTETQVAVARAERLAGRSVKAIAGDLSVGVSTLYQALTEA